ncbi:MAG: peptidylprolyl isomerase [Parcubacteria group bacterium]|jgi:hypothetical protein
MKENDKDKGNPVKKVKMSTVLYGSAIFVGVVLAVGIIFIYRFNSAKKIPIYIYNHIPLPAVIVDGTSFISIGEVNQDLLSIKKFYESQDFSSVGLRTDFTTEDGKRRLKIREKELINKMIEDRAIEILAKERGIIVSKKDVNDNVDRKMDEYSSQEKIKENLNKLYGWTIEDFKDKVVRPGLYKDELEKWLAENDGKEKNEKSKKNSADALAKIKKGEDFSKVLKDISKDDSILGGKLGWFKEDQLSPEIRKDVVSLNKGNSSDILESDLGYHIIKLDDVNEANGVKLYEISQLFFPKTSFANWLDKKIKEIRVSVLLTDYVWNQKSGMVEFKDKKMDEFEKESLNKADKDASLLAL